MPNAYGYDTSNAGLVADVPGGERALGNISEVQEAGASVISLTCGFWYEWSLALGEQWYGFDIKGRKVTFIDQGETRIVSSTWRQCGRAVAALLEFPVRPEDEKKGPCLEQWKNKPLYIKSFLVSQRDMLDSLHRVVGTTDGDWEIRYEESRARYEKGLEEMRSGMRTGFAKVMYTRCFYPNGGGDFEGKELANEVLGLPKEDLDDATRLAVEMVESGWNPLG